jgi:hypothetical protein
MTEKLTPVGFPFAEQVQIKTTRRAGPDESALHGTDEQRFALGIQEWVGLG